jgi:translation initiation factor 3 subunit G
VAAQAVEAEPTPEQNMKNQMIRVGAGKVVCKLCKGEHFTVRCPYKDSLAGLESTGASCLYLSNRCVVETHHIDTGVGVEDEVAPPVGTSTSKYIPPSMRGARGPGESMSRTTGGGSRDDLPTLRVTNLSEDTQEGDLRDLFGVFGRVARVYVGRDRETGAGKGFAFVSFEERANAQRAMEKVNGRGYDNLILSVQWSRECVKFCCRCYALMDALEPRPEQK